MNFKYIFKYIIVGDTCTGKTSLVDSFVNKRINTYNKATIGVEFSCKLISINNNTIKILIWDTAGLERFRSITKSYYKNSSIALIIYDITNRDSFLNLEYWYQEIVQNCNQSVIIVIVGNKSDLEKRKVSYNEGYKFAENYNLLFFETSIFNMEQNTNIFEESCKLAIKEKEILDIKEKEILDIKEKEILDIKENNKIKKSFKWCCYPI